MVLLVVTKTADRNTFQRESICETPLLSSERATLPLLNRMIHEWRRLKQDQYVGGSPGR